MKFLFPMIMQELKAGNPSPAACHRVSPNMAQSSSDEFAEDAWPGPFDSFGRPKRANQMATALSSLVCERV
jgi:hypothetical protein